MLAVLVAVIAAGVLLLALLGLVGKNAPLDKTPFRENWRKIKDRASKADGYEIAIINADKLLDLALKKKRFGGETMGERLISAKDSLSRRQAVWDAHKLRNRIVHEQVVKLDAKKVSEALRGFESALKDLGAL